MSNKCFSEKFPKIPAFEHIWVFTFVKVSRLLFD